MKPLIAIVGPTGIGKSQQALHLAQVFDGEIIGADSRQVYRYMAIGTAKPGVEDLSLVPHHLIDIVNPDEDFSLARYQEMAYQAINDIHGRQKLPFLVGGSGLYVWAVLEGWEIPQVPPDLAFRQSLEKKAAEIGIDRLYQELSTIDPVAAQKIDPRNVRRVIRALEVHRKAKAPFSQLQGKKAPPFNAFIISLTTNRAELYRRIDLRVDEMINKGLVAEVKKLIEMGYNLKLPSMSGIGYKQIGMYLRGELPLAEAVQQIKTETHRVARHQYAWFRLKDERIHWFDVLNLACEEIEGVLAKFLSSSKIETGKI